jgi:hypothetical protein
MPSSNHLQVAELSQHSRIPEITCGRITARVDATNSEAFTGGQRLQSTRRWFSGEYYSGGGMSGGRCYG